MLGEDLEMLSETIYDICDKYKLRIGQLIYLVQKEYNLDLFCISDRELSNYIVRFVKEIDEINKEHIKGENK